MATWNRWIAEDLVDGKLVIVDTDPKGGNAPPNPPPSPNKPPRTDTATSITVYKADRAGNGAKIIYHDPWGYCLTGIAMKDGSDVPSALTYSTSPPNCNGQASTLTVTDTDPPTDSDEWSYMVTSSGPSSDPQIHNSDE